MNKEEKIELPNDEKAEKFLLNYTAATDWKEIEKLSWTSAECFELVRLAFTQVDQENKELINMVDEVLDDRDYFMNKLNQAESRIEKLEEEKLISNLNLGDLEAQKSRMLLDYNSFLSDKIIEEIESLTDVGKHAKFCDFLNNIRGQFIALKTKEG